MQPARSRKLHGSQPRRALALRIALARSETRRILAALAAPPAVPGRR
ncbi:MAG: hypothetical protein HRU81_02450 [Gammaproteobacteria bacterium]|nr:MAG: hypothetical protein HRU81_02450 [Gammaproteobacteria bacterium]